MIRFTLFRVPIEIQPWFWITGALVGGALGATDQLGLMRVLIFMVVMTISILVHEFGHALTGRYLGGGSPRIVLWAFGGLAYNQGARLSRSQSFWMIFMGPGAGFILLALTLALVFLIYGPQGGLWISTAIAFSEPIGDPTPGVLDLLQYHLPRFFVFESLIWINFWWGILNLLPVLPLDGGRIMELWTNPRHKVFLISTVTGALVAAVGYFGFGSLYMAVLFGYLAYRSYKDYQTHKW
jgi:membrane-associated protease RseP (regulator of RpoE activity)